METILPAGWTARYEHIRTLEEDLEVRRLEDGRFVVRVKQQRLRACGGETRVVVYDEAGRPRGAGVAYCRPDEPYVKALGQEIALWRACFGCVGDGGAYERHVARQRERERQAMERRASARAEAWERERERRLRARPLVGHFQPIEVT